MSKEEIDSGINSLEPTCDLNYEPYPFIDEIYFFEEGEGAGFGQESFPDIVFGPPYGGGEHSGSLDVLTIGEGGSIAFSFREVDVFDDEGVDLVIFENPFIGWTEPAIASASIDGVEWIEWPCNLETSEGCVGVNPVISHPENCIDATDPLLAGGDALDLATIGLETARYIKITDASLSGLGGFDLDSAVVIHTIDR